MVLLLRPLSAVKVCLRMLNESAVYSLIGNSNYDFEINTLHNKVLVATVNNYPAIARVALLFRSGTRAERYETQGVTQYLKMATGCSTKSCSCFALFNNLQLNCTPVTCAVGRETISYTIEGTKQNVIRSLPYLAEIATSPSFKPWELADNVFRLKIELENRTPAQFVVDLIHQAVYRKSGLGNSIFIYRHNLNKITPDMLQSYVSNNFVAKNCAAVGMGIDHRILESFATQVNPCNKNCEEFSKPKIYKSEIRSDRGGDTAHITIATEGTTLHNMKEILAYAIIIKVLGVGSYVKHSRQNESLVGQVLKIAPGYSNSITPFLFNYSDSGLFGVYIKCKDRDAPYLLENTMKLLLSLEIDNRDFKRGKQQALAALYMTLENASVALDNISKQVIMTKKAISPSQLATGLCDTTIEDVNKVACKIRSGKFSMASAGSMNPVPYLSDLPTK